MISVFFITTPCALYVERYLSIRVSVASQLEHRIPITIYISIMRAKKDCDQNRTNKEGGIKDIYSLEYITELAVLDVSDIKECLC